MSNNRVDKMKMKIEEPAMQEMMRGVKDVDDEEEEPQEVKQIATRFLQNFKTLNRIVSISTK